MRRQNNWKSKALYIEISKINFRVQKGADNMYDDIEELAKIYDLFINGIKSFSSDFGKQYERLKYAVIADELASDFCEVDLARARILYKNDWITREQLNMVIEIEHYLEEMNKNKTLWSTEAVRDAKEWEVCREMGRKLLSSLGY